MRQKTNNLYEFGGFRIDLSQRILWRGEETIFLAPKVFDTLEILIKRKGEIVSKDELMDKLWADSFVEEGNLTQNIYLLRQTLGKEVIETVPRRGYRFAADLQTIQFDKRKESFHSNGENADMIVAERTRMKIIEEEFEDDDSEAITVRPESLKDSLRNNLKIPFGVFAGVFLILIVGVSGFWFWKVSSEQTNSASFENIKIKALTDTGNLSAVAISPESRFLAYTNSGPDGKILMRLKDLQLGEDVNVNLPEFIKPIFLRFSPDGNFIYFLNQKDKNKSSDIYKITRFGGKPEIIAKDVSSEFSFSKDGKQLAFFRENRKTNEHFLVIKTLENSNEKILLKKEFPDEFFLLSSPAFSAKGDKVYAITRRHKSYYSNIISIDLKTLEEKVIPTPEHLKHFIQVETTQNADELIVSGKENSKPPQIHKFNIGDGTYQQITNDLSNYRRISVSVDGKSIVAIPIRSSSNLRVLPAGKIENSKQLTFGTSGRDGRNGLNISPDGKILYVSHKGGNRDVWIFDRISNSDIRLTKETHDVNQNPVMSPDGRYVYYISGENRSRNIKRMNYDGQDQIQITKDKNSNDGFPEISPDGKTLYFIRKAPGKSSVMKIRLPDGKPEKLEIADELIPADFLRISHDGRFLVFRNLGEKGEATNNPQKFINVAVISLDGSLAEPKTFRLKTNRPVLRWTQTNDSFDFIENTPKASFVKRLNIFGENSLASVAELPEIKIHDFVWTKDEKDLIVADINRQSDAILITGF